MNLLQRAMMGDSPTTAPSGTLGDDAVTGVTTTSSCSNRPVETPVCFGDPRPLKAVKSKKWRPHLAQPPVKDPADPLCSRPALLGSSVLEHPPEKYNSYPSQRAFDVGGWARENSGVRSDSSSIFSPCPALEVISPKGQSNRRPSYCFCHSCTPLAELADRLIVLLWRVFTLKIRHPLSTTIAILAPSKSM